MGEEIKDVNKKIDDLEAAAKKYASKDTVISIGGYEFTPAKLMVAFTLVSSTLGGLYGAFEVYKDYQGMKKKIAEYVSPDLEGIHKKIEILELSTNKAVDYTNEIKNDLKRDLRRTENVVENIERSNKDMQRDIDKSISTARNEMRTLQKEVDTELNTIKKDIDKKIKNALDNPLANK